MSQTPLEIWRERLTFLQREEATAIGADSQFALMKQIEKARAKIAEFDNESQSRAATVRNVGTPRPRYNTALCHTFDLREPIKTCRLSLKDVTNGLIGFFVPCTSPTFLRHFCERIKFELRPKPIQIKPHLSVDRRHTPPDKALQIIEARYLPCLDTADLLFSILILEELVASVLWQRLLNRYKLGLQRRMVVVLGSDSEPETFPHAVSLTCPRFDEFDVLDWIRDVVESRAWPTDVIDLWQATMLAECRLENDLVVDLVYGHLEDVLQLLTPDLTVEDFVKKLHERNAT